MEATRSPLRTILTIVMDVLIVIAVAETVRMVVVFFGAFSSQPWGELIKAFTDPVTLPFGIEIIKTPYGGFFDVNAALTVAAALIAEWVLSVVRSRS
ncbi:MAG: hypothetical protein FDZ75_07710 [Actinobacteria bacterium]|nr:MAG: hypothetical protein FDZ75_07710 [Actinomycetota bacterium]